MSVSKALSICIPTFNRAGYLAETLENLLQQATPELEIVVSDNASHDDTAAVVAAFQARHSAAAIRYHRFPSNVGFSRNLAQAISLASGEYCWLFGSDDCIVPGAIARVLAEVRQGDSAIYLSSRRECSSELIPYRDRQFLTGSTDDEVFDFSVSAFLDYVRRCCSLAGLFSYISSLIVRRRDWDAHRCDESILDTYYPHVFVMFSIAAAGGRLKYLATPLTLCRCGNDSFSNRRNPGGRIVVDLAGYYQVTMAVFPADRALRQEVFRVLYDECRYTYFPLHRFLKVRVLSDPETWAELKRYYVRLWGRRLIIRALDRVKCPRTLMWTAISIKNAFAALPVRLRKLSKRVRQSAGGTHFGRSST
jgi:abequosyltransferase